MKTFLKFVWAILFGCITDQKAFAQNKKKVDPFPTYDQIRGDKKETVDYVSPGGDTWLVVRKETVIKSHLNAFSYSEDSVTYLLNGKKVKSKKKAEYEVNRKDVRINRISIGEVGQDGKRIIEIDYEPFKED